MLTFNKFSASHAIICEMKYIMNGIFERVMTTEIKGNTYKSKYISSSPCHLTIFAANVKVML